MYIYVRICNSFYCDILLCELHHIMIWNYFKILLKILKILKQSSGCNGNIIRNTDCTETLCSFFSLENTFRFQKNPQSNEIFIKFAWSNLPFLFFFLCIPCLSLYMLFMDMYEQCLTKSIYLKVLLLNQLGIF